MNLTGSIGPLVRFVERGHVSTATADEYLKWWIDEEGFRSPARYFEVFLPWPPVSDVEYYEA